MTLLSLCLFLCTYSRSCAIKSPKPSALGTLSQYHLAVFHSEILIIGYKNGNESDIPNIQAVKMLEFSNHSDPTSLSLL